MIGWSSNLSEINRLEQLKLIYDYVKFHIGLYLATPPVFAVVAESFGLGHAHWFEAGLAAMIVVYLISGIHASFFMARLINDPWDGAFLSRHEKAAFSRNRRFMHHTLYFVGLVFGLAGLVLAYMTQA